MMRDRECLMEIQLQFSNNLDALLEYFHQLNPRDTKTKKFVHPNLKPIYDSLSLSLASVLEITDMLAVLYPFFSQYDENIAKSFERGEKTEALHLIQQEAAFTHGAAKISRGLLEYLDQTLYEFEEYYNPSRVRNFIEYARLEMDPNRRYKLDTLMLPTPPMVEVDSDALYRAIGDATTGVVGNFEPTSPPYYPIDHIPLSEKVLRGNDAAHDDYRLDKLTPEERNARYKVGLDELTSVRDRRQTEIANLQQRNLFKAMSGYTDEELDDLGSKFHAK